MNKAIAIGACGLLLVFPAIGQTQTETRYNAEPYAFFGRRSSTPGTDSGGGGIDVVVFKGLAAAGEGSTTVGNPNNKITIWSVGGSYHFRCCHYDRQFEPFAGAGYSFLRGNINTNGFVYPFDPGQNRSGYYLNQGLVIWPAKHIGVRFEAREYRFFVSYGALENVIPGGKFLEFRIAATLR